MTGRVAFYAPLKPPDHPIPSGDRRMARSLIEALEVAGWSVEVAARFRSYDRTGDRLRQRRLRELGGRLRDRLLRRLERRPPEERPVAWLSYHVYHKSPDHLGPEVSRALGIPYLIAEASAARKRACGPWAQGYEDSLHAIRHAAVVFAVTAVDAEGLAEHVRPPATLRRLPPFTDPVPLAAARARRAEHRAALVARFGLDPGRPWLLAAAMMRPDVKLESYRRLGAALARLLARPWQLIVVGDGGARAEVEAALRPLGGRVVFVGVLTADALAAASAAADLFVWPALGEAYGLAMLEAEGSGLPVVAGRSGGVAEVVLDGETGLLVPPDDPAAFAGAVEALLVDPERRRRMAAAASRFVLERRSLEQASRTLDAALRDAIARTTARSCAAS